MTMFGLLRGRRRVVLDENNPRPLDRDATTRIVRAAHSGYRDSLRDDPVALSAAAGGI
jgi:hypothetical protein